ncbi:alpha/beta fold hydrolase [Catenulispora yoronensis]
MSTPTKRRTYAAASTAAAAALGLAAFATFAPSAAASTTPTATTARITAAQITAAAANHHGPKPTVVLIHGGFADASNWNGVIKLLEKQGYPVIAPANPLRGIPTDSTYIHSVLTSIKGPIILVGHSYGGAVITNAVQDNPNVKALVYVAAFVPDTGEQLGTLITKFPGSLIGADLNPVPFTNPDGTTGTDLYLQPAKVAEAFAGDLPKQDQALIAAEQRPFAATSFTDPTTSAAWHTLPVYGVVAGKDNAIPQPSNAGNTTARTPRRSSKSPAPPTWS